MVMNGYSGHPQLDMVLKLIIALLWLVTCVGITVTFVIVAAASTHAVSGLMGVNMVLILFVFIFVLVVYCLLDFTLDPIPHHSVFFLFWR